jgi:hypothetical protein
MISVKLIIQLGALFGLFGGLLTILHFMGVVNPVGAWVASVI